MENENINYKTIIEDSGLPDEQKKMVKRTVLHVAEDNNEKKEETVSVPASYIPVEFHTLGKLDCPAILHFKDYTTDQLNDITLSYEDNMLENIVRVINENCFEKFDVNKCTQSEFIEILGTILVNFWRNEVKIPWMCDCQQYISVPDSKRQSSIVDIDLRRIDINMLPDNVHEPIGVTGEVRNMDTGKFEKVIYEFRFGRIGDLVYAREQIKKKFLVEQKKIDNFKISNVSKDKFQEMKADQQKELDKQKTKELIMVARSQCLLSVNGKNINKPDKYEEFKIIDSSIICELFERMNNLDLGFSSTMELECEFCHEAKPRRLNFLYYWFLPTDGKRKLGQTPIFTGI